jgi:diguanylate cyclase (GGDEF)-like protein
MSQTPTAAVRRFAETNLLTLAKLMLQTAFQPIAEISTGFVFGHESLMRGHDKIGFDTPPDLLDAALQAGQLPALEQFLIAGAVAKFAALDEQSRRVLFLNFDARLIRHHDDILDGLVRQLRQAGVAPSSVCIELSERFDNMTQPGFAAFVERVRGHGFKLAVDDFGVGYNEMKLLVELPVTYVKIDRYFVAGIDTSPRRRQVVRHIVDVAHSVGARVIAEGIETAEEFACCREAGCDLAQGWFVDVPQIDPAALQAVYPHLKASGAENGRSPTIDELLIRRQIEQLPTIRDSEGLEAIFALFQSHPDQAFFPVVDAQGAPLGIVHERQIKSIIYQPYGRDLLKNKTYQARVSHFMSAVPVARLDSDTDRLVDLFAHMEGSDCVILTEHQAYVGVLSATALIRIINEKQLKRARDQNPLTGLPGNGRIRDHVRTVLIDGDQPRHLCYCDFDHFKPFNDCYGFQLGDQAILLFASLLQRHFAGRSAFIGHVGGDDFFLSVTGGGQGEVAEALARLLEQFRTEVAQLYNEEHRRAGAMPCVDRTGVERVFPLMRCSVAALEVPVGHVSVDAEGIGGDIARLKRAAKASADGLALARLGAEPSAA